MLPPIGENPADARASAEDRAAEEAWLSAEMFAPQLADRQVAQHQGDTLAALWTFVVGRSWRLAPDDFEALVHDATVLELQSRLTRAEAMAWEQIQQDSETFQRLTEATRVAHQRHRMTSTQLVRMAA